MDWNSTVKGFSAYLSMERSLSPNSVEAYIRDVEKLASTCRKNPGISPENVSLHHLEGFIQYIDKEQHQDERSQARIRSGIRSFYKYLLVEDLCTEDPTELLEGPKLAKKYDVLSLDEINAMISLIDLSTDSGVHQSGHVETLYACGLRVSELVNLRMSMIYEDFGFVKVIGKNNKERIVPIGQEALKHIRLYVLEYAGR